MKALIDADILLYEVGFAAEYGWMTEDSLPNFEYVKEILDGRIDHILQGCGSTMSPIFFFTGEENFRNDIARKKEYKGNRKDSKKPFHLNNIRVYLKGKYDWVMHEGLEADDLLAMHQHEDYYNLWGSKANAEEHSKVCNTIICTRDKDLRQVNGWHYTWECGKQPSWGPFFVHGYGEIFLEKKGKSNKLTGYGDAFFYAQLLMGDPVDNIPGLKGYGPVKVYELLEHAEDSYSAYTICKEAYKEVYELEWGCELHEQARLVHMVREFNSDGYPVMWTPPKEGK